MDFTIDLHKDMQESLRVLFITDSLGLDAAVDQPEEHSVSYITLFEKRVRKRFSKVTVERDCLTGRTSKMLRKLKSAYEWNDFDKIFIQIGIVDCAPRVLSDNLRKIVNRIRPIILKTIILKGLKKLHTRWFFKYVPQQVLVNKTSYGRYFTDFIKHLKATCNAEVYLISILPTTDKKEYTYVGLSRNIEIYNSILESISAATRCHYLDFYNCVKSKRNEVIYDGVHLNEEGKELLVDFIFKAMQNDK